MDIEQNELFKWIHIYKYNSYYLVFAELYSVIN